MKDIIRIDENLYFNAFVGIICKKSDYKQCNRDKPLLNCNHIINKEYLTGYINWYCSKCGIDLDQPEEQGAIPFVEPPRKYKPTYGLEPVRTGKYIICPITGNKFKSKSNRQKYCKTRLCGVCPLREPQIEEIIPYAMIQRELIWKFENKIDFMNKYGGYANTFENDNYWGVGNEKADVEFIKNKKVASMEVKEITDDGDWVVEYHSSLNDNMVRKQVTRTYNVLCNSPLVFRVDFFTKPNQYKRKRLKSSKYYYFKSSNKRGNEGIATEISPFLAYKLIMDSRRVGKKIYLANAVKNKRIKHYPY